MRWKKRRQLRGRRQQGERERPAAAVLEGGRRGAIPPPPSALAGLLVRPAMVDGCYWLYLSECGEQVEVNDAGC